MTKKQKNQRVDFVDVRHSLNLNQTKFWSRVGVTQSGGSRYESGRRVPETVQTLLDIAYGSEKVRAATIERLVYTGSVAIAPVAADSEGGEL